MSLYNKCKIPIYTLVRICTNVAFINNKNTFLEQGMTFKIWHMEYYKKYEEGIYHNEQQILQLFNKLADIWETAERKFWHYRCLIKFSFENSQYIIRIAIIHKIYYLENENAAIYINEMNKENNNTRQFSHVYDIGNENKYKIFLLMYKIIKTIVQNKNIFNDNNYTIFNF